MAWLRQPRASQRAGACTGPSSWQEQRQTGASYEYPCQEVGLRWVGLGFWEHADLKDTVSVLKVKPRSSSPSERPLLFCLSPSQPCSRLLAHFG